VTTAKKVTAKGWPTSQAEIKAHIAKNRITINDWTDLHATFENMSDSGWIFRGVSSPDHLLIPSIGRESVYGPYKLAQEQRLFQEFKHRAYSLLADPRLDEWDWLAYAQHIGVPTRLLDWSVNPLVAAYFALEKEESTDRAIYAVQYSRYVHEVDHGDDGPFACKQEGRFTAPLIFDRIRAQRGIFTVHPVPTKIFYPAKTRVFLIEAKNVKPFRKRLFKYGVDHWHIYPDAQGLGQQMAWQYKNKIGLGSVFGNK
jgi:hypothetical protein